ncbi:LysR family transcriptional regulator [Achromobacter xylosoxidans]|uniref:LysR family transcriptional regulator n=1 Tax=Alcaligenes xylosoxydans xylosoxydans TaxID=85698 RepID=UPI0006C102CE|nr:LysR family transcriptional regulator [Achromobacter xylosoxidans]MCH4575337.1 LysR family transcriptional regulator [Achromobacter xylosoxidans]MDD7988013.1 LysR family transcriptional regulator [Achromobacter xylosoxidans]OFO69517.1 LysR family transcriptional regulator [Achromobacter xylosoxidans]OMG84409.1 LysR family transcriptional regulator [Achromobacter xylosoxidans]PNL95158.1 LysR family transcriptional regulator [Achromobacter xylosoxidans]
MKRNFNIHDLRIFYTVVMTGSTRQAAQAMHLTQPAVSHAISRLEQATGVQLFDRSHKTLRPTEAGQYLYSEAKHVLDELVRIDEALHSIEQFGGRNLRIAASPALALAYAPDAVRRYLDANGTRPFSIDLESSVQVISAVETMRADFGLGAVSRDSARLAFLPFLRTEVMAIVHRDHPLARQEAVAVGDIRPDSYVQPLWSDYVMPQGDIAESLQLRSGMQAHMSLLPGTVRAVRGISMVNALSAADIVQAYPELVALPLTSRQWFDFVLITRKESASQDLAERLLDALRAAAEDRRHGVYAHTIQLLA